MRVTDFGAFVELEPGIVQEAKEAEELRDYTAREDAAQREGLGSLADKLRGALGSLADKLRGALGPRKE